MVKFSRWGALSFPQKSFVNGFFDILSSFKSRRNPMWIGGDVVGSNSPGSANLLNVEYKTGRYHMGRPVYCKLVKGTASASAVVELKHGSANVLDIWVEYGYWTQHDGGYYDLYHSYGINTIYLNRSIVQLNLIAGHYVNGWTAYVMLNYTKSTDPVVTA